MRKYRRARRVVAIFLSGYFVVGLSTLLLPGGEIFPFYSWFLFALVPQKTPHYELLLHEIGDRVLQPPIVFSGAGELVSSPHSVTVYQLTQKIGATNDASARALLEQHWLPPRTRYEIIQVAPAP